MVFTSVVQTTKITYSRLRHVVYISVDVVLFVTNLMYRSVVCKNVNVFERQALGDFTF